MSNFVMGATLTLRNQFSQPISQATRSTQLFGSQVQAATGRTRTWTDAAGRLRDAQGRYISSARRATTETTRETSAMRNLNGAANLAKRGVQGLMMAFGVRQAYNWLVKSNADMETYKNTLTVVLGSEKKAVETMAWAQKFAASTPFEIPQIIEATTRMQSYGLNAKKTLGTIGDMASVMGKPLMDAVEAVADAQTGELERLKEFGITKGMLIKQAAALGTKPVNSQGQITDQVALNAALFSLMEKRFNGGMKLQSTTFTGMLSNAADFMGSMGRTLGQPIFDAAKQGLGKLLQGFSSISSSGIIEKGQAKVKQFTSLISTVGGIIFQNVAVKVRQIWSTLQSFYTQNKATLMMVKNLIITAFVTLWTYARPILMWLNQNGLPVLLAILKTVATWILNIANFIITNWSWIGPFVAGLAIAFGLLYGAVYAYIGYLWLASKATKIWAAAQAIFNAVMNMNPIFLVVTLIGLLIGAGILLVKNWDKVSAAMSGVWDTIKGAFVTGVNFVIRLINGMIEKINSVTKLVGIKIPMIAEIETKVRKGSGSDVADALDEKKRQRQGKASSVNPAGVMKNMPVGQTIKMDKMVEKIEIHAAPGMDEDALANKVVTKMSDSLKKSKDKKGNTSKGALL